MKGKINLLKPYFIILFVIFMSCKKEDVNNAPIIINQTFSIDENSPNGTHVGNVTAIDPENDVLSYEIRSGNTNEAFNISINSGIVTVSNENAIDYETTPVFSLLVEVTDDKNNSTTAAVIIELNNIEKPNTGMILHLPFNGSVEDISSNHFNCIVHGATPTMDSKGRENNAFFFDGVNDYIEIEDNKEISFSNNTNFTISVWAEVKSSDKHHYIVSKYHAAGNNREFSILYNSNLDCYVFAINNGSSSIDHLIEPRRANGWCHIVGRKDDNKIYLFINNVLVSEKTYSTNQLSSFAKLLIGACDNSSTSPDGFFHGNIDDVVIYNRALSNDEIKTLFME